MGARNHNTIIPTTDMARTATIISMREAMPTGMARDMIMTSIKVMGTHNTPSSTIHKMAMARPTGGSPLAEDMAGWDTAAVEGGPHQGRAAIHQTSPSPIRTQTLVVQTNNEQPLEMETTTATIKIANWLTKCMVWISTIPMGTNRGCLPDQDQDQEVVAEAKGVMESMGGKYLEVNRLKGIPTAEDMLS
ncbi:unnamed protein product [Clonostachys rosea f. rosea IK726]|uniref:Uncharacterized protein n=1 Tax=Clonostachys rosea f. rosea IK726 TaxID=1349383 RepID=A0ACA9TIG0_BIOOC|nr:unnamed protein product [Clonostachys rosea f. rosea IK726]